MRSRSSLMLGFQPIPDRRARPTCKLSLATASASTTTKTAEMASTTPGAELEEVNAMQVDSDPLSATTVTTGSSPLWSVVPFPTSEISPRRLALLRSCPSVAEGLSSSQDPESSVDSSPPRKRTRTAALLAPTSSPKFHRSNRSSLTLTRSTPPSRLPRSAASLLFSGHPPQPPPKMEPFTYTFLASSAPSQTNMTAVQHSRLLHLISELVTSVATEYSPSTSIFRRKKSLSGGTYILYNMYKSLLHGLASRYLLTGACLQDSTGGTVKSQLDVQDALLAEKLRWHLTLQGHDVSTLPFEVEKTDNGSAGEPIETDNPFLSDITSPPPQTEASSTLPGLMIMRNDQLVSFLFLQKRLEGRNKSSRKCVASVRNNRTQSKLTESFNSASPLIEID